jgi:predicted MFS family arabinose efflux permease
MTDRTSQRALWVLLFGNLVIGTGVLLPAGILTELMSDLDVTAGRAGLMMTVGGLVVGIGAPLLAATTSAIDRRLLLVAALLFYVVGHLASALTDNLYVLLALRAVTVAGAAIFTPQAAATVGLLVPPERRGSAIAFIFIGWSLASVLGIPAGSLLGAAVGWRETFLLMAALSGVGAAMVWFVLPGGLRVAPLDLSSWSRVLTDWRLLTVLAVTMLSMSGQFTLFTYIGPLLTQIYGLAPNAIALTLLLGGSAGVLGSILATRLAARLGLEPSIMLSLGAVALGVALIWLGWGQLWALIAGVLLWNLGGFPANSLQQGRLVALAPPLASATVALNTSFVYLGQSLGSATGGRLVADGPNPAMPLAATAFLLMAMLLSRLATRKV